MQKMQETPIRSLNQEDPLEQEMAALLSILAWKIPDRDSGEAQNLFLPVYL